MISYRSIATLLGAAMLGACGADAVQQIAAPASGASIKFFNFAVATPPAAVPAVNFYANDTKITAITSTTGTESTAGTASGGVGNGGAYSQVTPGAYTIAGKVTAATDNGLAIATLPGATLADGKYYSFYMSGYYNTTAKATDVFLLEDAYPLPPDLTVAYVRFVNAAVSGTAGGSNPQTLYAKNPTTLVETAIGGPVAYKAGSAFVTVPIGAYDLSTRYTGSTTNVVTRAAVGFSPGRIYTITAFGDALVTGTTAANRIRLDNTLNR